LKPTISSGFSFAVRAADSKSISAGSFSCPVPIPSATMFRKASTRVLARVMIWSRKSGKSFHPDEPASTIVVTPLRNENASGLTDSSCARGGGFVRL
jgi:hypothetical protein